MQLPARLPFSYDVKSALPFFWEHQDTRDEVTVS